MLVNVQALRAVAALMVVLYHSSDLAFEKTMPRLLDWGSSGVDLFFVISGYIMVHTTRAGTTPLRFARSRIERIVPFYWLITLAVFLLALAAPQLFGSTKANLTNLAKSLFFIPYMKGSGLMQPMVFVGWTLNLEMFFYAIFALCLLAGKQACWVAITALVAFVAIGRFASGEVAQFLFQPLILEFAAGMLIAKWMPRTSVALALGGLAIGFGLFVAHAVLYPELERATARLVPSAIIMVSALSLEAQGRTVKFPLARLLGNASFALYLLHPFIAVPMVRQFSRFAFPVRLSALVVIFVVSCALAIGVHRTVELPVANWLRGRRKARTTPAQAEIVMG